MNAGEVIELMFKLRGEAYSIWALVFGINTAVIGWILARKVMSTVGQKLTATTVYLLFVLFISTAFWKTYDELNRAVLDLDYALKSAPAGVADEGLLSYLRTKHYGPHFAYAMCLNGIFLVLITAIIWRRDPPGKDRASEVGDM